MPRKSVQEFAEELGLGPIAVREMFRRMRDYVIAHEDNRIEFKGVGIFYRTQDAERWIGYEDRYVKLEPRTKMAFRVPARKGVSTYVVSPGSRADFTITDWVDDGLDSRFAFQDGSIVWRQDDNLPHGGPRETTFLPSAGDELGGTWVTKYETGEENPPGTWVTKTTSFIQRRRGAGWDIVQPPNDMPTGGLRATWANYLTNLGMTTAEFDTFDEGAIHTGTSKKKAAMRIAFQVMTGKF